MPIESIVLAQIVPKTHRLLEQKGMQGGIRASYRSVYRVPVERFPWRKLIRGIKCTKITVFTAIAVVFGLSACNSTLVDQRTVKSRTATGAAVLVQLDRASVGRKSDQRRYCRWRCWCSYQQRPTRLGVTVRLAVVTSDPSEICLTLSFPLY